VSSSRPAPAGSAARASHRGGAGRAALVALLGATLSLGACKALRHKEDTSVTPEVLYARANKALREGSYAVAVKGYEALTARYPFSDAARQSRIDLIYAYYKEREKESAVDAADTFIRENPTHPRIDYAYYIKGLVYFERDPNFLERWFDVDMSERPPQDLRKSFDAFARVVSQYPHSDYAADARQRMVYLRNRLADYEIHVARYYLRRGAWVAAVDRSRYVLENYDGAPATRDALEIMIASYRKLDMPDLAADTSKVLALNFPAEAARLGRKHWWQLW